MSILFIFLLVFVVVLLVLVILNVPVSQKIINIVTLAMVAFLLFERTGWIHLGN